MIHDLILINTKNVTNDLQTYWEVTSDSYFEYIKKDVVGIGPWKDTVVPAVNNYLQPPTNLVVRAHAHSLMVSNSSFDYLLSTSKLHVAKYAIDVMRDFSLTHVS